MSCTPDPTTPRNPCTVCPDANGVQLVPDGQVTEYFQTILNSNFTIMQCLADQCGTGTGGTVDFSNLTVTQITQLTQAIDFTQLTTIQQAALCSALIASGCDLTSLVNFAGLSLSQLTDLTNTLAGATFNSTNATGPVFTGTGAKVATFQGDINVTGLIDPTGMQFSGPQADAGMPLMTIYISDGSASGYASGTFVFKDAAGMYHAMEDGSGVVAGGVLDVVDQAARLASGATDHQVVRQTDTGQLLMLIPGGNPAIAFDWRVIGKFADEVVGNVTSGSVGITAPAGADLGYNPATGERFYVDASGNWQAVPVAALDLNTTVGATQVGAYAGAAPVGAPASPDDGDLFVQGYSDVIAYWVGAGGSFPTAASVTIPVGSNTNYTTTDLASMANRTHTWTHSQNENFDGGSHIRDFQITALPNGPTHNINEGASGRDVDVTGGAGIVSKENFSFTDYDRDFTSGASASTLDHSSGRFIVQTQDTNNSEAYTSVLDLQADAINGAKLQFTSAVLPDGTTVGIQGRDFGASTELVVTTGDVGRGTAAAGSVLTLQADGSSEFMPGAVSTGLGSYTYTFTASNWAAVLGGFTLSLGAATHGLGTGFKTVQVFDSAGDLVTIETNVDAATGAITLRTSGSFFDGTMFIVG